MRQCIYYEQSLFLTIDAGLPGRFLWGYEDGTFRPNNALTRAEAVTIVNRMSMFRIL
ncbi:S-layer homology domain-containing protein [Paenibacillus sp. PAMC21692]|uniref:S-layer homology domain-containing protein n=1 Tax=Paenibacillus sp. PAMC21692 TaxID=2762320 RepID=UPI00164DD885|nr:S-layer homology domain-containing protein [Paenibacillus sp. PAMC21692]